MSLVVAESSHAASWPGAQSILASAVAVPPVRCEVKIRSLDELPTEVLELIMEFVDDYDTLRAAACTCRTLATLRWPRINILTSRPQINPALFEALFLRRPVYFRMQSMMPEPVLGQAHSDHHQHHHVGGNPGPEEPSPETTAGQGTGLQYIFILISFQAK